MRSIIKAANVISGQPISIGTIGGENMTAADMVLAMTEHQAKMKLMSLLGSISAVADATNIQSQRTAIDCLIANANENGLLQQLHLDSIMFDAE